VVRHVSVELLADHPQHLETLARWHCEEDCDGPPLEFWRRQLRAECGRDRIPIVFVALDGETPLGHVSLVEHNMSSHPELSPWLAGTLVHPAARRGNRHCARAARGVARDGAWRGDALPVHRPRGTSTSDLGWRHLWDEDYEGEAIAVLAITH
jgi:hypothetical protein